MYHGVYDTHVHHMLSHLHMCVIYMCVIGMHICVICVLFGGLQEMLSHVLYLI